MGIYAVYENAIRLMVPRDLHLGDEEFDQVQVGERIRVEIQKSRFQLKDPFIVSVGIYRGRAGEPTRVLPNVPKVVNAAVPVAEEADTIQTTEVDDADDAQEDAEEEDEQEGEEE
jgi:hypothetical protein